MSTQVDVGESPRDGSRGVLGGVAPRVFSHTAIRLTPNRSVIAMMPSSSSRAARIAETSASVGGVRAHLFGFRTTLELTVLMEMTPSATPLLTWSPRELSRSMRSQSVHLILAASTPGGSVELYVQDFPRLLCVGKVAVVGGCSVVEEPGCDCQGLFPNEGFVDEVVE